MSNRINKIDKTMLIHLWMIATNGIIATGVWLSWLL